MAKKRRIRNFFKNNFNLKVWIGYDHIKSGAGIITTAAKTFSDLPSRADKYPAEDFQDALLRLNLSEADIATFKAGYYRNFLIFFMMGTLFALYSIYRFNNAEWASGIISLCITIIGYVFSMAMHFWYFQIKNRKLGCSFREWFANKIN